MKKFIVLFSSMIILLGSMALAEDTLELVGPGITFHVIDGGASNLYSNQISHDGRLIFTPEIGIKKTHIDQYNSYNSLAIFTASNSIGSPVWGMVGGTGARFLQCIYAGFVGGGYIQNNQDFKAKGITPFSVTGDVNALVPILGVELNFKGDIGNNMFVAFNNIITPIITNHNLSIGVMFK